MSVTVPHIPGDGRLDTLFDNQLDSSACQLRPIALLSVNAQPNTLYKLCVLCSPNSRTIVSASLGRSLTDVLWSQCGHPPNVVACTLLSPILQDVRVCPYRGCVPSGRVSCGEEWQLTGGCGFKKHMRYIILCTIVQASFIGSCVTWRTVVPYYIQLASVHGSLIHTVPTPTDTHSYTLYFL